MNPEYEYLIHLIKCVIRGEDDSNDFGQRSSFDIHYNTLFQIAKAHSVANIAAYSVKNDKNMPDEIKKLFDGELLKIVKQQANCAYETKIAFTELDKNGIACIPLKGFFLKNLYPEPAMRSMSDIDVFAEDRDMGRIYDIMTGIGFDTGTIGSENHYEYIKNKIVKIEFHPELIALDSAFGKTFIAKNSKEKQKIADICNIWNNTAPVEGYRHIRQLTPEYAYVYVIMHMANHFITAGTGIRSVMDVWIMQKTYGNCWNRETIDRVLSVFSLQKFERCIRRLSYRWFGPVGTAESDDSDEETIDSLQEYIFSSGTYGTLDQEISQHLMNRKRFGKIGYLFSHTFLPYRMMSHEYPVLKRFPFLLPAMWVYRVFDILIHRKQTVKSKLTALSKNDYSNSEKRKKLFSRLGI